jgi:hypothetical protein
MVTRKVMKPHLLVFLFFLLLSPPSIAQILFIGDNYFPADKEFSELLGVIADVTFEDPDLLTSVDGGELIREVGFAGYAKRTYSTGPSTTLSIEVITAQDNRAAYSLLTLLRDAEPKTGPPGNEYVEGVRDFRFAQGRRWVRITGTDSQRDLLRKIAVSVSNRVGTTLHDITPSLIRRLPQLGYEPSSLKYFPGISAYETYSGTEARPYLQFHSDIEIVSGRYALDNDKGSLYLLNFPTPQLAEDFFSGFSHPSAAGEEYTIYLKQAGPLVAFLDGTYEPAAADALLNSIEFSFSVRWLHEDESAESIMWGVPLIILETVVNSVFFVSILCVMAIFVGIIAGFVKFLIHERSLKKYGEESYYTRLRLR